MSRIEILSSAGLRQDNRRPYELRQIDFKILTSSPNSLDGSSSVSHGLTKVTSSISGPKESTNTHHKTSSTIKSNSNSNLGSIQVYVNMSPFSTSDRKKSSKMDKRLMDLSYSIQNTFESVIMLNLYPRSVIEIFIEVLQEDGGLLQAAINATSLSLIASGISIKDYIIAISIGSLTYPNLPLLDITNLEQTDLPFLTIATLPRSSKICLIQLENKLNIDEFEKLCKIGIQACEVLKDEFEIEVKRWMLELSSE
ncbi:ribosomal protein S5 domain 2-type protein [Melampsora americana]|nr:ribosomal protein S5 domain 2-type protein [Melampsora americana]